MSFETWLAFALASAVVIVIPGPTVTLAVSYALGQGWRAAAPLAAGTVLGDATAFTMSMLGVGALLAASSTLFTALRWIGALYLVWLGWTLLRSRTPAPGHGREERAASRTMFAHAWLVTALNPKSITFFIAFLPQFLDEARPLAPQATALGATFVGLAAMNIFAWTWLAARTRALASDERALRWFNRAGGLTLIGAGAWLGFKSATQS